MGKDATLKDNIDLLRDVLKTQNQLIKEEVNSDLEQVPRMLALYKEVEPFYYGDETDEGLKNSEELENVILMLGSVAANIDLSAAIQKYEESDADALAICMDHDPMGVHHRFNVGPDGYVSGLNLYRRGAGDGLPSLEAYIFRKDILLELMDYCRANNHYLFHRDAITLFLSRGGKMTVYVHEGYANSIRTVEEYYQVSRDMLKAENRRQMFPAGRPVRAKTHEDVSTYYGETARSVNSLVGDKCIIEGDVENCIIFSGVHVAPGAKLRDCIIMKGCDVGEGAELSCVIADKACKFSPASVLIGSPKLPTVVPKGTEI